jgi:cysteinyl-tRNA synthetase
MINVDGDKMSKSLGNFWTIGDALEQVDPLVLRYTLINAPYRQPVDFNSVMIDDSQIHHGRLVSVYGEGLLLGGTGEWEGYDELAESTKRLKAGMDDDFNTRVALVEVQSVARHLRALLDSGDSGNEIAACVSWISEFAGGTLGLLPDDEDVLLSMEKKSLASAEVSPRVEELLVERETARAEKDWGRADEIRDELTGMGIVVEDGPDGPTWRLD